MRAVVQRVSEAHVAVEGRVTGAIGRGLVILLGIHRADGDEAIEWIVNKILNLRILQDTNGMMNRSVLDQEAEVLVVSQFTLYGDARKGNRPSYDEAAPGEEAHAVYQRFVERMSAVMGRPVATGEFGAMMDVHLVNDGPVTILLDSFKQF